MSLFKKDPPPAPVGAKEKQRMAAQLRSGNGEIKSRREGQKETTPTTVLIAIYFMSCGLSFFLTMGPWKNGAGFKTGHDGIDDAFLSSSGPTLSGDPTIDMGIFVLLRGLFLFFAAGALPALTYLWIKLADRPNLNIFRSVWGVSVGVFLAFFLVRDGIWPLASELFKSLFM